jgi:hypothetical protein
MPHFLAFFLLSFFLSYFHQMDELWVSFRTVLYSEYSTLRGGNSFTSVISSHVGGMQFQRKPKSPVYQLPTRGMYVIYTSVRTTTSLKRDTICSKTGNAKVQEARL